MVDDKCSISNVKIQDVPSCAMTNITETVDEIYLNPNENWKNTLTKGDRPYYLLGTLIFTALTFRVLKKIKVF